MTETLLKRVVKLIAKSGPVTFEAARLAMFGGSYDRRDAGLHNRTIMEWVSNGSLKYIELPNGDGLLSV